MFERFTAAARGVVVQAQQESRELGHRHIGTEHLLLALLAEDAGLPHTVLGDAGLDVARVRADVRRLVGPPARRLSRDDAAALETIGIDLDAVLAKIEETFGPDALQPPAPPERRGLLGRRRRPSGAHRPFTQRAKKVLELSLREAVRLQDRTIEAEHILLGLLRDGDGTAAKVMIEAGVDLDALRRSTLAAMKK